MVDEMLLLSAIMSFPSALHNAFQNSCLSSVFTDISSFHPIGFSSKSSIEHPITRDSL